MNNIVKKLYIGSCYVCGKPIREDDMYGTMEDSDTLYCKECWNEYAERCDALIEQMKKEKAEPSTNENVESKCGKIDDKLFEKEWKRYMSSKKDDLSGRAVSVNVKDVARHFYELGMNARKEVHPEVELFERPETPIKDAVEVTSRLRYIDEDLKPIAEFIMDYASWNLHKDEWNQPTIEVPLFRVLDALAQRGKPYCGCGG